MIDDIYKLKMCFFYFVLGFFIFWVYIAFTYDFIIKYVEYCIVHSSFIKIKIQ